MIRFEVQLRYELKRFEDRLWRNLLNPQGPGVSARIGTVLKFFLCVCGLVVEPS